MNTSTHISSATETSLTKPVTKSQIYTQGTAKVSINISFTCYKAWRDHNVMSTVVFFAEALLLTDFAAPMLTRSENS